MAGSASLISSPCAACKFLRRKCTADCVFAPYFPPDQPQRFASVHRIYGASNVSKLINEIPLHHREDAVNSLVYEAEARLKDPVYGSVGIISLLQQSIVQLQTELVMARSELSRYVAASSVVTGNTGSSTGKSVASPYSQPVSCGPPSTVFISPTITGVCTVADRSLVSNIGAPSSASAEIAACTVAGHGLGANIGSPSTAPAQASTTSASRNMAGTPWDTSSIALPVTIASHVSRRTENIQDAEALRQYTAAAPLHNSFCKMEPP